MDNNRIEVHFTHPRNAQTFTAELDPNCTGQVALQGLIAGDERGPFLEQPAPGRPYQLALKRNHQLIPPNTTFADAGVTNGDVIEVRQDLQGA